MITREEAKAKIWDNKSINTLSKVESSKVIDDLFDQFESQLSSNPLQLMCDGCEHQRSLKHESMIACGTCSGGMKYNFKKDTK